MLSLKYRIVKYNSTPVASESHLEKKLSQGACSWGDGHLAGDAGQQTIVCKNNLMNDIFAMQ